ncbi:MAG: peroxiredoxin [Bacteroidetes bacterium]|nr:peroxiredoxin [Bacteroidota bacterium]
MRKITIFITVILISFSAISQDLSELNKGDKVDKFSALDDQGNTWKSSDVTSDFLVVYFYPAAMTGGCTKQACAYRDDKASFDKMSISVIGVSGDEVKNLQYFKEAYQLNFPLLSDNEGAISKIFGIPTKNGGEITREIGGQDLLLIRGITTPRWTFVLDKNRTIIYKNAEVNAAEDSKKVKAVIQHYINSK